MKVSRTITQFLLGKMNPEKQDMHSCEESIEKNGKGFKMEQTGSEKKYSFCIPPERETKRVAVYEACIDALAHMTLEEGKRDKYRLSLGGIAAPKENALIQSDVLKSRRTHWKSF